VGGAPPRIWLFLRAQGSSWYLPALLQYLTLRSVPGQLNSAPGAGKSAAESSAPRLRSACARVPRGPLGSSQTAQAARAPLCSRPAPVQVGPAPGRHHGSPDSRWSLHAGTPAPCALNGVGGGTEWHALGSFPTSSLLLPCGSELPGQFRHHARENGISKRVEKAQA
jgi:hypothetical protein